MYLHITFIILIGTRQESLFSNKP